MPSKDMASSEDGTTGEQHSYLCFVQTNPKCLDVNLTPQSLEEAIAQLEEGKRYSAQSTRFKWHISDCPFSLSDFACF